MWIDIHFCFWQTSCDTLVLKLKVGATSHTRLRARDLYTSSTLIDGKAGAGPILLPTTLEGPMEYIRECKMDVKSAWIPT
jgi:hypothetical protein